MKKTTQGVQRRSFLGGLLTTAAGAALAGVPALGHAAAANSAAVGLDRAKWSPRNWQLVAELIASQGSTAPGYKASRRPYAVFDWDNTSIMNDCEEALLMHQINTLSFKLTPA